MADPLAALNASLAKFRAASRPTFTQNLAEVAGLADKGERIARDAAQALTPAIRAMVRGSYAGSGLKNHTGTLAKAVAGAIVTVGRKKIYVRLAPEIESKSGSSVYTYGGALQYGAVRQPKIKRRVYDFPTGKYKYGNRGALGVRAARTLKKLALGEAVHASGIQSLKSGIKIKSLPGYHRRAHGTEIKNDTSKSVVIGGVVVIKPRPFFTLTPAQVQNLQATFTKFVQASVNRETKPKAGAA